MKIAVISDIHENFHNLVESLKIIESEKCDIILALGDYCNPGIIKTILSLGLETYFVWGDNDGKKSYISELVTLSKNGNMSADTYRFLELEGLKICMTHFTDLGEIVAKSGEFDLVFCGHTHMLFEKAVGRTLCVNPGEISTHKTGIASFYVYDTETKLGKHLYIDTPVLTCTESVIKFHEKHKIKMKR